MAEAVKNHNTIGCCGIDCGLCPRNISQSASACPGCGAHGFYLKHPSCGFLTCCAKKKGLDVCALCREFPCLRFDREKEGVDSFVSHQKVFYNQAQIKEIGIAKFLEEQSQRIEVLRQLTDYFDNGRSKSFFCQACTLLPLEILQKIYTEILSIDNSLEIKDKNRIVCERILAIANELVIDLNLRKK